jgi:hypothetical protein
MTGRSRAILTILDLGAAITLMMWGFYTHSTGRGEPPAFRFRVNGAAIEGRTLREVLQHTAAVAPFAVCRMSADGQDHKSEGGRS